MNIRFSIDDCQQLFGKEVEAAKRHIKRMSSNNTRKKVDILFLSTGRVVKRPSSSSA